ncbi:MAG TPA: AI-2E family transporter [Bryobacteraceae bacterium]|nr:AI-2E family transporter [Bryobacteraceae bacterium]
MVPYFGNRRSLRGDIVFAFALIAVGYLAWLVRDVLLLLFVSALFAVILSPVVHATARLRVGRWQPLKGSRAILFLLLAMAGAIAIYISLALPPVVRDIQDFSTSMPTRLPVLMGRIENLPFASHVNTAQISAAIQGYASHAATTVLLSVRSWAGGLANIAMGVILTVYFILEGDQAYQWFLSFFPPHNRARLDTVLQRAGIRMGRWLLGQGTLMLILGVASTIVFAALNVRYAYALGVLTGLLNVIPVLGAAISIALALVIAAIDSWGRVLGIIIFYAVYIQVENSYLTPRIMQSRVHLPGIAVIVALLLGFSLAGVIGALVSVPTAVLVTLLLQEYLVQKDVQEQSSSAAPDE